MYSFPLAKVEPAVSGQTSLSFRRVEGWRRFLGIGKSLDLLMGDDVSGPYILFSWFGPMADEMPRGPAHGHDSDTWRISIQGTTNVGKYAYSEGQFRFQDGGVSYPGDNVAWGAKGGFWVLIFGDRRGWAARPVDQKVAGQAAAQQRPFSEKLGISVDHPRPGTSTIRSTLGATSLGHLDWSFKTAQNWEEISRGTRAAISFLGEVVVGPVLVLLNSDPGAKVVPGGSLITDVLHVVVEGSCTIGGEIKKLGDFWLTAAGVQPEVVAGPEGLSHIMLIGERQKLSSFNVANEAGQAWLNGLVGLMDGLRGNL